MEMSIQQGGADIAELVRQMEQSEDDPRRCYALVQQRINALREAGQSVPVDLKRMEQIYRHECQAESQGR